MSFVTQAVAYSWSALAGVSLTGSTMYVSPTVDFRVYQRDLITIVVGDWERAEATRTGINSWGVTPPIEIRQWITNYYTNSVTNSVTNWYAQPYTNIVTNCFSWRSDYSMLTNMDAKLALEPPYYTTNAPNALSVSGIFANLYIGDGTNKFTQIPCFTNYYYDTNGVMTGTVTNVTTYGPWAKRLYVLAMQERYKYEWALSNTVQTAARPWIEEYSGTGYDVDFAAAYAEAVGNYAFVTNGYLPAVQFAQTCFADFYSNRTYLAGSNEIYQTNLTVTIMSNTYISGTNITVTSISNTPGYIITVTTNVIVSGSIYPNIIGTYYDLSHLHGGNVWWEDETGNMLTRSALTHYLTEKNGTAEWTNSTIVTLEGDYAPSSPDPPFTNQGNPHVVYDLIYTTNQIPAVESGGTYTTNGTVNGQPAWISTNGCYIFYTNTEWVIATNTTIATNEAYLFNSSSVTGGYTATNFTTGGTTAEYSYIYSDGDVDPSGTYTPVGLYEWNRTIPSGGVWSASGTPGGPWTVSSNAAVWTKADGLTAQGDYPCTGTPTNQTATGIVQVVQSTVSIGWTDYYFTNMIPSGTDTVFFAIALTNTVSTNDAYSSSNIQHAVTYWVYPIKPTAGTSNYFLDHHGLGLVLTNWGSDGASNWSWGTSTPVAFGGDVTVAPSNTVQPVNPNESTCSGFLLNSVKAVQDWKFLYATNKFW